MTYNSNLQNRDVKNVGKPDWTLIGALAAIFLFTGLLIAGLCAEQNDRALSEKVFYLP